MNSLSNAPESTATIPTAAISEKNQGSDVTAPHHAAMASTIATESTGTSHPLVDNHAAPNELAAMKTSVTPIHKTIKVPNLNALRISPPIMDEQKQIIEIPVRLKKPGREAFMHAGPDWNFCCLTLEVSSGMEKVRYLLYPEVAEALKDECKMVTYVPYQLEDGSVHFMPLRQARDSWAESFIRVYEVAKTQWIRIIPDNKGVYGYYAREVPKPPPSWEGIDLDEIFRKAVSEFTIQNMDHPVVMKLRGAA